MKLIEQFRISKTGKLNDCEDMIFFNDHFAAVIDGATSRDNRRFNGQASGYVAAMLVLKAFDHLSKDSTTIQFIESVNREFDWFYKKHQINPQANEQILTASAVIYSPFFRQIWMIGDCQCLIDQNIHRNPNGIDEHIAAIRSLINQSEMISGRTMDWIMENDPGSLAIQDLLVRQFTFQNRPPMHEGSFHYTAFDGRPIDMSAVKIIDVLPDVHEIVLASDGYPLLKHSLRECEDELQNLLLKDPLCIYENKGVKGLKKGLVSFDDRSYLRFLP